MAKDARLSIITIAWGVFLVVSASFMLQVNEWLTARVGDPLLARLFWIVAIVLIVALVLRAITVRLGLVQTLTVVLIFALGYLVGTWQQHFAEKTHILTYGILGFLAARDLIGDKKTERPFAVLAVLAFVIFISAADEAFQYILPYRFGEIGDFLTNVVSGALGMGLFVTLRKAK